MRTKTRNRHKDTDYSTVEQPNDFGASECALPAADDELPPIDFHFDGDRTRYLRDYARTYREDVVQAVQDHREVRR